MELNKYPLIPVTIAVIGGIVCALLLLVGVQVLFFVTFAILILSAVFIKIATLKFAPVIWILLLFTFASALRTNLALERDIRWKVRSIASRSDEIKVQGRVQLSARDNKNRNRILLRDVVLFSDSLKLDLHSLRVWLVADSSSLTELRYGDDVIAQGQLKSASESGTIGSSALIRSLVTRETATIYADSDGVFTKAKSGYFIHRSVDRLQEAMVSVYEHRLSKDGAALCKALMLGDRGDFSKEFTTALNLTGLSHIFALSGMNVGLLVSLLWLLLGCLFIPHSARYWILLFVILLYMELGRETPSLLRASIMCGCFIVGRMLNRRAEILNYIAAAACIELLWKPLDLLDAGFQLSYLAIIGIFGCYRYLNIRFVTLLSTGKIGYKRFFADILAGTLSAQIGTIPLIGFMFHRIPLIGVLGNLIAVPGFAILLFWSVLLLITEAMHPFLSSLIAPAVNGTTYLLGESVKFFSYLPLAAFAVHEYSFLLLICIYAVITGIMIGLYFSRLWWSLTAIFLAGNLIAWGYVFAKPQPLTTISFIDVGNGDSIVISTSNGSHILVDTGPAFKNWTAAERVNRYLNERRITNLDALILTHPENDHIGGAAEILARLPIKQVYVNGDSAVSRSYFEFLQSAKEKQIDVQKLEAGSVLVFSPTMKLKVLSPDSATLAEQGARNSKGIVLRLEAGSASALLTADIDSSTENKLLSWGNHLDVDLLKIAHHGSKGSSCQSFLQAVTPTECVISVSKQNRFGHPSHEVIDRLSSNHIPFVTTAKEGTITFATDGNKWKRVSTESVRLAKLWSLPYD